MDWFGSIDQYCERLDPEFWAEPVNALSNVSFIIAAVFAYRLRSQLRKVSCSHLWLTFLLLSIGVGSFLFHTHANLWSMMADVIPIYIFQLSLVTLYGAAIARIGSESAPLFGGILYGGVFLLCFVLLSAAFAVLPTGLLNGSVMYFSSIISLIILAFLQPRISHRERHILWVATACFALSLFFRSVDMEVCNAFSLGTHFLWHTLNGLVLYLVIRAYVGVLVFEEQTVEELRVKEQATGE